MGFPFGFFARAYRSRIDPTVTVLVSLRCVVHHKKTHFTRYRRNRVRDNGLNRSAIQTVGRLCSQSGMFRCQSKN
jgi:hypothetical protein